MCKIHRIHCSIKTLKNSINKITEFIVIFKKIGKCFCMRFFFCRVYVGQHANANNLAKFDIKLNIKHSKDLKEHSLKLWVSSYRLMIAANKHTILILAKFLKKKFTHFHALNNSVVILT